MKLRKLSLQGYKTFASKTEFEFDNGITAIVGPNGSGKSNIADALRWVLGEQSYSSLRAKRSADMIFAGSEKRARSGMAQATITLDNSDGWLPIDYTEVEISRRSHRSGENEYLLNGQQVRLKDVIDLLATSGLSERTYTIIGQGLIDQALSLRSDERRALFEEAAGINHYKARRAETLRRLDETHRNLQRVHDILAELRPRVTSLKRQATRTQTYEQVSTDLHELLRIWYGYRWEHIKAELRGARQAATTADTDWQNSRQAQLATQQQIDALQRQLNDNQQKLADQQGSRETLREQLETSRRELAVLRERRDQLQRQLEALRGEQPALSTLHADTQTQLSAATEELLTAQQQLNQQQAAWDQFHTAYQSQQQEIERWQKELAGAETEQTRLRRALDQADGQLAQLRERVAEAAALEDSDLTAEMAALDAQIGEGAAKSEQLQAERDQLRQQLRDAEANRESLSSRVTKAQRHLREQEQLLATRRGELARLEERVTMLERTRTQDISLESNKVLGQLAGLVRIPSEYEAALAAALGERLAIWIVPETADLWRAISQAGKRKSKSDAGLLVAALADVAQLAGRSQQARPDVANEAGVHGWASDLVESDAANAPVIDLLLGSILVVDTPETAYRLAREWPRGYVAVTPDGFVAHAGGFVESRESGPDKGILAREAAWRKESARLQELGATIQEQEETVTSARADVEGATAELEQARTDEQALRQRLGESGEAAAEARRHVEALRQRQTFLTTQQEKQAAARSQLHERIEQIEVQQARYQEQLEAVEARLLEASQKLAAFPVGETQQQQDSLRQSLVASQTIVAGRQAVVDSRRSTLNQVDGQLSRLQQRMAELEAEAARLADGSTTPDPAPLQAQLDTLDEVIQPLRLKLQTDRKAVGELQPALAQQQKRTYEAETQLTQRRIKLAQVESQVETLQERIHTDLGLVSLEYDQDQDGAQPLPIRDVVEELPVVDSLPDGIEKTIQDYRGQLQRIGPINPEAPEELTETEARIEFLTQQIDDLTETDEQLREVIAELDELTSQAFSKTVAEVNEIFGATFRQLFGGGAGRLEMTDPDDLTSSGVEIVARLPGRREQPLALLSGGERSLTAAALIFSLLKVAPPPFCVLDEVDAALDEANVGRFRELVQELSEDIQFILITHNRGTVQAAKTIYGVSMQPDSASQVISIKPEEYVRS